jgi:hypothetical protein
MFLSFLGIQRYIICEKRTCRSFSMNFTRLENSQTNKTKISFNMKSDRHVAWYDWGVPLQALFGRSVSLSILEYFSKWFGWKHSSHPIHFVTLQFPSLLILPTDLSLRKSGLHPGELAVTRGQSVRNARARRVSETLQPDVVSWDSRG